jgi:hypothetical protein
MQGTEKKRQRKREDAQDSREEQQLGLAKQRTTSALETDVFQRQGLTMDNGEKERVKLVNDLYDRINPPEKQAEQMAQLRQAGVDDAVSKAAVSAYANQVKEELHGLETQQLRTAIAQNNQQIKESQNRDSRAQDQYQNFVRPGLVLEKEINTGPYGLANKAEQDFKSKGETLKQDQFKTNDMARSDKDANRFQDLDTAVEFQKRVDVLNNGLQEEATAIRQRLKLLSDGNATAQPGEQDALSKRLLVIARELATNTSEQANENGVPYSNRWHGQDSPQPQHVTGEGAVAPVRPSGPVEPTITGSLSHALSGGIDQISNVFGQGARLMGEANKLKNWSLDPDESGSVKITPFNAWRLR